MGSTDWSKIFDCFGIKVVTPNDKKKGAYVPNAAQRAAIRASGITPAAVRPAPGFRIDVLFDSKVNSVEASYYYSERSQDAARPPEPRMGHSIISSWLTSGDRVLIGNIGTQLFAAKLTDANPSSQEEANQEIIGKAKSATIISKALAAKGKPIKQLTSREEFIRNPYIVAAALLRAVDKCEMPDCDYKPFQKDDGKPYLEVHHIDPLSEGGDDTLINAAALCPRCHRELHFGKDRMKLRAKLRGYVECLQQES